VARRPRIDAQVASGVYYAPVPKVLPTPRRKYRILGRDRGQGVVEVALVLPMVVALIFAVLEYALAFHAVLSVNQASQNAAHIAAIVGNMDGADCMILAEVEQTITTPADRARITEVAIQRTALAGNVVHAANTWVRTGSTTCTHPDGSTTTVPYSIVSQGYPDAQRCMVLSGCPTMTPPRSTVDNVGVMVAYDHPRTTPLGSVLPMLGGAEPADDGWTFRKRNIFRMEPVL